MLTDDRLWGRSYVNGVWQNHREDLPVLNPSTGVTLGFVPIATVPELNKAVAAAKEAMKTWGNNLKWSWVKRAEVVYSWVRLVEDHKGAIAELIALESGKQINEARADVTEGIHMLQVCASHGRQAIGNKVASEIPDKESEIYLAPRGVCVVITPWNFPFAIPTWLIGPALVSGNTVVFKPSEETPLTAQYLVDLWHYAALKHHVPPGTLNLVYGRGDVGEYLVCHPDTAGQLFTGSYAVGEKIKIIAATFPRKFAVCEMGGKNSLLVLKDADLDKAVEAAVLSAYKTTHQRCVSADLLIVEKDVEPEFTRRFVERSRAIKFGDPFDETNFAGPLINGAAAEKWAETASKVAAEGAETLIAGRRNGNTNFVTPNVFRMTHKPNTFALCEEFFTPNVVIVPVKDFEEALFVANDTNYGLAMALWTNDYRLHREFKIRGKAGLKYVNLPTIGAEVHLPFGGMDQSGSGHPSAVELFSAMCYKTAFTVNYGSSIQLAQGLSTRI